MTDSASEAPTSAHPVDDDRAAVGPVLEVAIIDVHAGTDAAFTDAYRRIRSVLAGTEGVRSVRMTQRVERPGRFVLLVEWDSLQAHLRNFRATDRWVQWRAAIGPFFAEPPLVEHYTDVDATDTNATDSDPSDADPSDAAEAGA